MILGELVVFDYDAKVNHKQIDLRRMEIPEQPVDVDVNMESGIGGKVVGKANLQREGSKIIAEILFTDDVKISGLYPALYVDVPAKGNPYIFSLHFGPDRNLDPNIEAVMA